MEVTGDLGLGSLADEINALGKGYVDIGVFDGEMMKLAGIHEFGAKIKVTDKMRGYLASQGLHLKKSTTHITIPERAPLRNTADDKGWQKEVSDEFSASVFEIFEGKKSSKMVWESVGLVAANGVRDKITEGGGLEPANHPFTIKNKKGSERPLVDTGQLLNSYTHRVKK